MSNLFKQHDCEKSTTQEQYYLEMLPISRSRISEWVGSSPTALANHNKDKAIPQTADLVVIGSGLSGISLAYHATKANPKTRVVVLEARQFCSGATGRNGGHLFPDYIGNGPFERLNYKVLNDLVEQNGLDVWTNDRNDIGFVVLETAEEYAEANAVLEKGNPDGIKLYTTDQAKKKLGIEAGTGKIGGALSIPSSPINPYRLVTWLTEQALSAGAELYTSAEVVDVEDTPTGNVVSVTRPGNKSESISVAKVIFATNGFTSILKDKVRGLPKIEPIRAQVCRFSLEPSALNFPLSKDNKVSLIWGDEYLSVVPDVESPGKVSAVLGGMRHAVKGAEVGVVDDNGINDKIADELRAIARNRFGIAGEPVEDWTGIMGFPQTGEPYVGRVPGHRNIYITAGYGGHGMPRIFLSSQALLEFANNGAWPAWFPQKYRLEEHISRL